MTSPEPLTSPSARRRLDNHAWHLPWTAPLLTTTQAKQATLPYHPAMMRQQVHDVIRILLRDDPLVVESPIRLVLVWSPPHPERDAVDELGWMARTCADALAAAEVVPDSTFSIPEVQVRTGVPEDGPGEGHMLLLVTELGDVQPHLRLIKGGR